jgi:Tfp pilus assembly protein PilE
MHRRNGTVVKIVTNRAGFTVILIELMMVVGIAGVLTGLAVPAYSDYASKARLTELLLDMDDIATRAIEYQITTGAFPDQMDLILDSDKKNKMYTSYGTIEAKKNQCDSDQGMYGIKKVEGDF